MNKSLVFLCGSLESGRDGVGDYAQVMAQACNARGWRCRLGAFADKHLADSRVQETPERLRLGAGLSWAERSERLRRWLALEPDGWVSWQLVPYALDPKGIVPPALRRSLAAVREAANARTHLMLHELWIGMSAGETWKARVTGWMQARAWRRLIGELRAEVIHTSNPVYRQVLQTCGQKAQVLPLPGNLPLREVSMAEARKALEKLLPPKLQEGQPRFLAAMVFGTVHPQWQPGPTLAWLRAAAEVQGSKPVMLFAGRSGHHGRALISRLQSAQVEHGVTCIAAGELGAADVSVLMQAADCGLGLHPWALIGKSGATAAMLEHGLPVLVPRDDWKLRIGATPAPLSHPRLARLAEVPPERAAPFLARRETPKRCIEAIADLFLNDLEAGSSAKARLS